jgi:hypothetical protein
MAATVWLWATEHLMAWPNRLHLIEAMLANTPAATVAGVAWGQAPIVGTNLSTRHGVAVSFGPGRRIPTDKVELSVCRLRTALEAAGSAKPTPRHAIANAFRSFDIDGGEILIGADTSGRFLEVGVRTANNGETIVFHVMPARDKFLR